MGARDDYPALANVTDRWWGFGQLQLALDEIDLLRAEVASFESVGGVARDVRWVAAQIRALGNPGLVSMCPDGVRTEAITLADYVWLLAVRLDGEITPEPGLDDEPPA